MRLLRKAARLGRLCRALSGRRSTAIATRLLRRCCFEELEPRQLRAGDLHLGAVYFEEASGDDSAGDRLEITFAGGEAGTQLNSLTINGDKLLDGGVTLGDIFFDTTAGGAGSFKAGPLSIVSHDGFTITRVAVEDGSPLITFHFSGFNAGEKLVFEIDVDEQGSFSSTSVAEGGEFEGSRLIGAFTNPHFENATLSAIFYDEYDDEFAQAAAQTGTRLELPPDSYVPPHTVDRKDRTAGAVATFKQVPKPITIAGRVFHDPNLSNSQDASEPGLAGVSLTLLQWNGTTYIATGKTATTNAIGDYRFDGVPPGTYRVVETQPSGYLSVGSRPGTVSGATVGVSTSPDIISEITLLGGQDSLRNDFAEVIPGSISGRVYADPEGDCVFGPHDTPLAGVEVQLLAADGTVLQTMVTGADGQYTFEGLLPGAYGVHELQPDGYYQGSQKIGSAGGVISATDVTSQIVLRAATDAVDYDFCELFPARLSGRVFADPEGDGELGANDLRLGGVAIELLNAQGAVVHTIQTNAQGEYSFTNLAPGIYTVREIQPAGYYQGGQRAGSHGGNAAIADVISHVNLGSGANGVHYDFWELIPGSISGRVHADTDGDCTIGPNDILLADVTVQLLNDHGIVVATTLTDAEGRYRFDRLAPGVYSVREIQPAGYFHGDEHIGTAGGVIVGDDFISQIVIGSGTNGASYDFCEVPGGAISGYVFQDGPTIISPRGQPIDPATVRNGIRDADDLPIAGVTLLLGDFSGQPILDALGRPRTAVTDASGFYEFTSLPPGLYTVRQIQPADYLDFVDTPGTTGGIAINRNDQISPLILQTLTVAHDFDAIIRIPLPAGVTSVENNFSEIRIVEIVSPPPPPPQSSSPLPVFFAEPINPAAPRVYSGVFLPPAPAAAGPLAEPPAAYIPPEFIARSSGGFSTWHLSVVNGGTPRGARSGETLVEAPSSMFNVSTWTGPMLDEAQWMLVGDHDEPAETPLFGASDAIPVAGDFNGDGRSEIGVFLDGDWFIDIDGDGVWDEDDLWAKLGAEGDHPVVGDWDGDGKDDIGVFGRAWAGDPRAIAREPGLPHSLNDPKPLAKNIPPNKEDAPMRRRTVKVSVQGSLRADLIDHVFNFGATGDEAVAGDWAGNGVDCIGVFRNGVWHLDVDGDGLFTRVDRRAEFGRYGDVPVVGDWNGDGIDELGVYRDGEWILDTDRNYQIDAEDQRVHTGGPADKPVVGDWNGDGRDQPGLMHAGRIEHEARR